MMMMKSAQCCTTAEKMAAASIIHGIGPQKYPRNLSNGLRFFPAIRCSRISPAASLRRPYSIRLVTLPDELAPPLQMEERPATENH